MVFAFVWAGNYGKLHSTCAVSIPNQPMMCHSPQRLFRFHFYLSIFSNEFDSRVKAVWSHIVINQDPLIWSAILRNEFILATSSEQECGSLKLVAQCDFEAYFLRNLVQTIRNYSNIDVLATWYLADQYISLAYRSHHYLYIHLNTGTLIHNISYHTCIDCQYIYRVPNMSLGILSLQSIVIMKTHVILLCLPSIK